MITVASYLLAVLGVLSFAALLELSGRPQSTGMTAWAFNLFVISALLNTQGVVAWYGSNRALASPCPAWPRRGSGGRPRSPAARLVSSLR